MFRGCSAFFKRKTDVLCKILDKRPKPTKPETKLEKLDWSGYTFDPAYGLSKTVVIQVKSMQTDDRKCKRGKALKDDASAGPILKSR